MKNIKSLQNKNILVTGAARRIGQNIAIALAEEGANLILHHGHSSSEALATQKAIEALGQKAWIIQYDLLDLENINSIFKEANNIGSLYGLINNASIFEPVDWDNCDLDTWNRHIAINLTAPFLLSQSFAKSINHKEQAKIINILDWRALRPGYSHLPYTISKAALAALTKSLAISLAPNIAVNAVALGAILPPADGGDINNILEFVPMKRWANIREVEETIIFLMRENSYITGEIIHIDGGRHLV